MWLNRPQPHLLPGRWSLVAEMDTDRYGRTVAFVSVDGESVNQALVARGVAWVFPKYCKESFCADWYRLEENAREQRFGMWQDSQLVPPWEWRRAKREGRVTRL